MLLLFPLARHSPGGLVLLRLRETIAIEVHIRLVDLDGFALGAFVQEPAHLRWPQATVVPAEQQRHVRVGGAVLQKIIDSYCGLKQIDYLKRNQIKLIKLILRHK